jgi:ribonucleotide reductase alpha subunit
MISPGDVSEATMRASPAFGLELLYVDLERGHPADQPRSRDLELSRSAQHDAAARRQKWIDQGQSLNLYMAEPSGKKLDNLYKLAWVRGLKTTYYLRSLGATAVEKSAIETPQQTAEPEPKVCSILDPDCEACQ